MNIKYKNKQNYKIIYKNLNSKIFRFIIGNARNSYFRFTASLLVTRSEKGTIHNWSMPSINCKQVSKKVIFVSSAGVFY